MEAAASAKPFREVPAGKPMPKPDWLSTASDGEEELKYKRSLINGVYHMRDLEEDKINELIKTFETRDNDVFICTYPKSGTTWVQQIISLLLNKGEQWERSYMETIPWLETLTIPGPPDSEAGNWTLEALKATPNRRFMKSHASLKELPAGTAKGLKVIYVARNPKDVVVSFYHHARAWKDIEFEGISHYIRFFVQGRCESGSWFDHVLEWWEAAKADPEHVLFLKYESILADPEDNIHKIADFAGIQHNPEIIAQTVASSTLAAMKKNPHANVYPALNHLRKGGAGGWRDYFTVKESEAFDEIYKEQMKGSGLQMDFGEGLVM